MNALKKALATLAIAVGFTTLATTEAIAGPSVGYQFVNVNVSREQCQQFAAIVLRDMGLDSNSNVPSGDGRYVFAQGQNEDYNVFIDCSYSDGLTTDAIVFLGGFTTLEETMSFRQQIINRLLQLTN